MGLLLGPTASPNVIVVTVAVSVPTRNGCRKRNGALRSRFASNPFQVGETAGESWLSAKEQAREFSLFHLEQRRNAGNANPREASPTAVGSKAEARVTATLSTVPNATALCGNVLRQAAVCDSKRPTNSSTIAWGWAGSPRMDLFEREARVGPPVPKARVDEFVGLSSKRGLLLFGAKPSAVQNSVQYDPAQTQGSAGRCRAQCLAQGYFSRCLPINSRVFAYLIKLLKQPIAM